MHFRSLSESEFMSPSMDVFMEFKMFGWLLSVDGETNLIVCICASV